jgi:hypothetical protein
LDFKKCHLTMRNGRAKIRELFIVRMQRPKIILNPRWPNYVSI